MYDGLALTMQQAIFFKKVLLGSLKRPRFSLHLIKPLELRLFVYASHFTPVILTCESVIHIYKAVIYNSQCYFRSGWPGTSFNLHHGSICRNSPNHHDDVMKVRNGRVLRGTGPLWMEST